MAIFSNQATLTYNGNTVNSNVAFGEILEVLTATKTAVDTTYGTDDLVTYVVTLRNTGTAAFNGLTITDDLGGYTFGADTVYPLTPVTDTVRVFVDGVLQAAPTVTAGPPLTVSGITVPAGGDTVIVYQARTNGFANPNPDGSIANTATVTGGGLTAPISATATIDSAPASALTITKSISPAQVVDNGQVTYTITIQNAGNQAIATTDNTVITDTFDPILSDISVTLDGQPFTQYTYGTDTGLFTTTAGAITVPAATATQDPTTGEYTVTPGITTLVITGTI